MKVSVDSELAEGFKLVCAAEGVSMTDEISRFMEARTGVRRYGQNPGRISTRRRRRKAVRDIIIFLHSVADAEETYRDNIPENLRGGDAFDAAEEAIEAINEAVALLEGAF